MIKKKINLHRRINRQKKIIFEKYNYSRPRDKGGERVREIER